MTSHRNLVRESAGLRRRSLVRLASALPLAALARGAWAQEFPAHPFRLIVPFPAGGPTDALARLAAESLAASLNQPVVVENKAGAGGGIAAELVSRSPADGSTLLVAGQGLMFINKPLYQRKKLGYDPDADYAYVGMLGSFPNVIVCNPDKVAAHTIGELLAAARANPGRIAYGSNGIGSLTHLTAEVLAKAAKVEFLHIPYQGAAPQMTDLLSGRIDFSIIASQGVMGLIEQKKVRALAVSTATRFAELPNVPTLVESGFPMLDVPVWFGVYAPAATPAPVLAKLRSALAAVTASPQYAAELAKRHAQVLHVPVAASEAVFARERQLWADAVRHTGASAE